MILRLCDRWGKTPAQIRALDAGEVLQLLGIEELAGREEVNTADGGGRERQRGDDRRFDG